MFAQRSEQLELMDQPTFSRAEADASFRFIRWTNRLCGAVRVVRDMVEREAQRLGPGRALRVLDVGSGAADIPLAVQRWASRRGLQVEFTCLERNGHVAEIARRAVSTRAATGVEIVGADLFEYQPAEPFDGVVASMFIHHFANQDIPAVINRLRELTHGAILINDLWRSPLVYAGCRLLCLGAHPTVAHDALLSVRKGFRVAELAALLSRDGEASVSARLRGLGRIEATLRFAAAEGRAAGARQLEEAPNCRL